MFILREIFLSSDQDLPRPSAGTPTLPKHSSQDFASTAYYADHGPRSLEACFASIRFLTSALCHPAHSHGCAKNNRAQKLLFSLQQRPNLDYPVIQDGEAGICTPFYGQGSERAVQDEYLSSEFGSSHMIVVQHLTYPYSYVLHLNCNRSKTSAIKHERMKMLICSRTCSG